MGRSAIRLGQLVSTFGPGGLLVDRYGVSLIVCGLDHWYYREPEPGDQRRITDKIEEFRFGEWRLERLLEMNYFMRPPDYRIPNSLADGESQTPNVELMIPSLRFPAFFQCSNGKCNRLRQAEYHLPKRPVCKEHDKPARMNQVRFITVCSNGHIDEFPWRQLLGCAKGDNCDGKMKLVEQGGADLDSIRVTCSCKKSENLSGVTSFKRNDDGSISSSQLTQKIQKNMKSETAGFCKGRSLWHGPNHYEDCGAPIVATFPNATNVYHARTKTSISPVGNLSLTSSGSRAFTSPSIRTQNSERSFSTSPKTALSGSHNTCVTP